MYQRETEAGPTAVPAAEPAEHTPRHQRHVDPAAGKTLGGSLRFAGEGFAYVMLTQRSFRLQLCASAIAIGVGGVLRITTAEWALLTLAIALVLVLAMLNTAVEAAVDMVTRDYHPLAKVAKDIAAAALLLAAAAAVVVGGLIFGPHLWALGHGRGF